jgi:hypothetical protein
MRQLIPQWAVAGVTDTDSEEAQRRVSTSQRRKYADQCRKKTKRTDSPKQRAMLELMADTWDRLAPL